MNLATASVLLTTAFVTACVPFPVYKTLQPSARITVLDEQGNALSKAEATLISSSYPYGFEKRRETRETDSSGTAEFEVKREWRTETLMIHGVEVFFWNWCARKDGYVTYFTNHKSQEKFQDNLLVRLEPGESKPCPKNEFH
jgi:hypothetical protein